MVFSFGVLGFGFCFVLDMIPMLPRKFARLEQAGGLGRRPSAEGPASVTPFKLLPKASKKGPANIRPLKLLLKPSAEGQQVLRLLTCCPKAQQVLGLLNCCLNPPQRGELGCGFRGELKGGALGGL